MTLLLLFFTLLAHAAQVNVNVCGELSVNFTDVTANNSLLTDDYIPDNADRAARGAYIRVTNNTTSTVTEYVLANADPACVTVSMTVGHSYDLRMLAKADVNGNTVRVWNNDSSDTLYVWQGPTNLVVAANLASYTFNTTVAAQWNILAAASWALHRRNAGLSGETITLYTQTCPGAPTGTSCYQASNDSLYISAVHSNLKYPIVHELGHNVARLQDNGLIPNKPALASPDGACQASDGPMIAKRNVALAADEGLAWYFAAVAFNDTTENDCDFYRSGHDWDQDGGAELGFDPNDELTPSCQGKAAEGWSVWDYMDYMCGGTLEDRGVYLDWMRAFWDADATHGLTTTEIFDLWVEAVPSTWDGDGGSGCDVDEDPCDPEERLHNAAVRLGIDTEWDLAAGANGVH